MSDNLYIVGSKEIKEIEFKLHMQEQTLIELSRNISKRDSHYELLWEGEIQRHEQDHKKHTIAIWLLSVSVILLGIAHVI